MRKKIWLAGFLPVLLFSLPLHLEAQDGVFSDAQTLRSGQLSLGLQSLIYTEADDFMLMLRGGYGIQSGLTLHGKVGVLGDETYAGGHFEYQVADERNSAVSFALLGGVYSFGDIGLKTGGVLSKRFDPFSIYTGLTFEPLFRDNNTLKPLMLPVGVDIPFSRNAANFIMEADIAVNDDGNAYQAISFGINFYL